MLNCLKFFRLTRQHARAAPAVDAKRAILQGALAFALCGSALTVHANGNNCLFQSKGLFLNFGTLDPSSGRNVIVTVSGANIAGDCAPGQTMTISGDNGRNFNGSRNLRNTASGDLIPYSLNGLPQSRRGPGNGVYAPFSFDGAVLWSAYANAPAGMYSDTIVIFVTP